MDMFESLQGFVGKEFVYPSKINKGDTFGEVKDIREVNSVYVASNKKKYLRKEYYVLSTNDVVYPIDEIYFLWS